MKPHDLKKNQSARIDTIIAIDPNADPKKKFLEDRLIVIRI